MRERRPANLSMLSASLWYVEIGGEGCWEWLGSRSKRGYGRASWNSRAWQAHRLHWVAVNGPIPDNWDVDHLCRNTSCVRIGHLEAVPHRENVRRGVLGYDRRSRTHCPYGHPYSGSNLELRTNRSGTYERKCKTCGRIRWGGAYQLSDKAGRVALLEASHGVTYEHLRPKETPTHCPLGHEMTGSNLRLEPRNGRAPIKRCRICRNSKMRERYRQEKLA